MTALELIAERRIAEALSRGELDNLPGSGQPLALDDDAMVPAELRMACRILKNAGLVPPEVEALRQLADLERCIGAMEEGTARSAALRRLDLLRARLEAGGRGESLGAGRRYTGAVLRKLAR